MKTKTCIAGALIVTAVGAAPAGAATQNIFSVGGTTAGFTDNVLATAAQFNQPEDVTLTADGGYLLADRNNDRIRKVSAAGQATTVAGTGTGGYDQDGV